MPIGQAQPFSFFGAASPDLYQQQLALQQQQALAQQMAQQGAEEINPARMAGRFVVPISPLEGLSHAGKQIAAAMMQRNVNEGQRDLYARSQAAYQQMLAKGLRQLQGSPATQASEDASGNYMPGSPAMPPDPAGAMATFGSTPMGAQFVPLALRQLQNQQFWGGMGGAMPGTPPGTDTPTPPQPIPQGPLPPSIQTIGAPQGSEPVAPVAGTPPSQPIAPPTMPTQQSAMGPLGIPLSVYRSLPNGPELYMANMAKERESMFAKINPKDFTADSVAKFAASGDRSVLVPIHKMEVANLGGTSQVFDPYAVRPGEQFRHTMTPGEIAANSIARANLGVKAATADPFGTLGIKQIAASAGAPTGQTGFAPPQRQASIGAGSQPGPQTPPTIGDLHGEDYLKSIPPALATQVKAYAEGRQAFPAGFALKSPYFQQMMQMVGQYDPTFDAVNYNARASTRRDFTSGQSAKNITALNTALGHMGTLKTAMDALDNGDYPTINAVVNWAKTKTGNPNVNNAQMAIHAVGNELMRVFRQVGASESETRQFEERLSASNSPAQTRGVLKLAAHLLQSRIDALNETYKRGMGTTADVREFMSPQAQATLQNFEGGQSDLLKQADEIIRGKR